MSGYLKVCYFIFIMNKSTLEFFGLILILLGIFFGYFLLDNSFVDGFFEENDEKIVYSAMILNNLYIDDRNLSVLDTISCREETIFYEGKIKEENINFKGRVFNGRFFIEELI